VNIRLEAYLRRASSGVPSAQRAVIQAELRGNIHLRATELELLGLTHAQGVERALEELGAPSRISRGMVWVHSAPRVARFVFAAMLAALCCIAPLNPLTVRVNASAVTDASGKLVGVNLETDSFSTAIRAAGIALSSTTLETSLPWIVRSGQGFSTSRSWDSAALTQPEFDTLDDLVNLDLTQALHALCDASARVTLESPSSEVVFRVSWQGSTARLALNLAPTQALEFHTGVGRALERPCQP
jgi:hypothetical protein